MPPAPRSRRTGTTASASAGGEEPGERPLLRMSELSERTGVSPGTIRYYLREGLLGGGEDVVRTSRNMAYYPDSYVDRISLIKRLQEERFLPLRVIRGALQEDPERVNALVELEDRIIEGALCGRPEGGWLSRAAASSATGCPATSSTGWRRSAC